MQVGEKAKDFALMNQDGIEVSLRDFVGKWVVLYFYPKDDTPGCTAEACEFTNEFAQFKSLGAVVVGISADTPEKHAKFIEKYGLKVTLLSDAEKTVLQEYGAWGEKSLYGKKYFGVKRTTYLIDDKGIVAKIWENVKAKGHTEKVKEELAKLKS
jgi:thioredoxin-dependent peroxiredoxin